MVAEAQLAAAKAAKLMGGTISSQEQLSRIERFEFCRGMVHMAQRILSLIVRGMRQEAAEEHQKKGGKYTWVP